MKEEQQITLAHHLDPAWYFQLQSSYGKVRGGEITNWPKAKYKTIYIDPPWPFQDKISPHSRGASHHYPCLSVVEIKALMVGELAQDNCLVWMWVPRMFRRFAEEVLEGWGFTPRTEWIWVKTNLTGSIRIGMGRYNRMAHEYLMLGTRGSARPLNGRREPSVILAPRGKHSEKPIAFYELIERNSLEPRIEMFATSKRQGWDAWGRKVDGVMDPVCNKEGRK